MKKKIFCQLSRRKRRKLVIELKNKIRNEKAEYGGKFLSYIYFNTIDNDKSNKHTRHWIDVYFPSKKDPSMLWNATIITCVQDLADKAESQVFESVEKYLTEQDIADIINPDSIPVLDNNGRTIAHKLAFRSQDNKEVFSGRTCDEEIDFQKEQNIQSNIFNIYERYEIYKDYAYGSGLTIVVNESNLDQAAVERAIEAFYRRGESAWTDDQPVDMEELVKLYAEVFKMTNYYSAAMKVDFP